MAEEFKLSEVDIERIVKRLRETMPMPVYQPVIVQPPIPWQPTWSPSWPYRTYEVWCQSETGSATFTNTVT